jgi:tetratricopeptide (TPR) repeat protein
MDFQPNGGHMNTTETPKKSFFRKLAQWFIALVVLPLALLACVEIGMHVLGIGHSTRPFIEKRINGENVFIRNRAFIEQFFTWKLTGQWIPTTFAVRQKQEKTYRIFVFGSSAAAGWPGPDFSFARSLKAILKKCYPDVNFEVYNAAFPGVNSHVMLPMAEACAKLQPDLFIVYMGNNEVHGPFGLMTMFRAREFMSNPLINMRTFLSDLRLMQIFNKQGSSSILPTEAKKQFAQQSGKVMPNDPRLSMVYANYQRNLEGICRAGVNAGAKVILSTMAVNVRHWAPSCCEHLTQLKDADKAKWDSLFQSGIKAETAGAYADATQFYEEAAKIDDTFAELPFRLGTCLAETGDSDKAHDCFYRALECDSFGWARARKSVNDIITSTAKKFESDGVFLADSAKRLADKSPCGAPGVEFFWDSCHPMHSGSYEIALGIFEQMKQFLPSWITSQNPGASAFPSEEECRKIIGLTPRLMADQIRSKLAGNVILGRKPVEMLQQTLDRFEKESANISDADNLEMLKNSYETLQPDYPSYYRYVRMFYNTQPQDEAYKKLYEMTTAFPYECGGRSLMGLILLHKGQADEARKQINAELELYPDSLDAIMVYVELCSKSGDVASIKRVMNEYSDVSQILISVGHALENSDDFDSAIEAYSKALDIDPKSASLYNQIGGVFLKKHDPLKAIEYFEKSSAMSSTMAQSSVRPLSTAAREYKNTGDLDTALALFRAVSKVDSSDAALCSEFGSLLEQKGLEEEALRAYRRTLNANPNSESIFAPLNALLDKDPNPNARLWQWKDFTSKHPENVKGWKQLARATQNQHEKEEAFAEEKTRASKLLKDSAESILKQNGDAQEALDELECALELDPQNTEALVKQVKVLEEAGNLQGASLALRDAIKSAPDNAVLRQNLVSVLTALRDFDGAWTEVIHAREKNLVISQDVLDTLSHNSGETR